MLLRERRPTLGRPHADLVTTSAYPNMKELGMHTTEESVTIIAVAHSKR
jgi:hypothetical protein